MTQSPHVSKKSIGKINMELTYTPFNMRVEEEEEESSEEEDQDSPGGAEDSTKFGIVASEFKDPSARVKNDLKVIKLF